MGPYSDDSFFQIGFATMLALLAISLVLAGLTLWLVRRFGRGRVWWARLFIGVAAFWIFEWVNAQVFYEFYRAISPGLPRQWVIGWPPGISDVVRLMTFQDQFNLSFHGRGALGWIVLLAALAKNPWHRRAAAN